MNLIEDSLREALLDGEGVGYDPQWSQEIKLERFHRMYVDLERKYALKLEDVRRLELEHKAELAEVISLNILNSFLRLYYKQKTQIENIIIFRFKCC